MVGHSENSVSITTMQAVIWIVTFLMRGAGADDFHSLFLYGRACRACAEDLKMASLLGINTDRVIALTFVIARGDGGGGVGATGQFYGVINPYIGFMAG
ncbi:hypothetical protein ECZU24_54080 [Escherichia coli]|nr:hypothetical protein ECZU24_54080 [Escherichia coli]